MFHEKYFHHNFRLGKKYLQKLQTIWLEKCKKTNKFSKISVSFHMLNSKISCLKLLVCLVCISSGCIDAIDHIETANAI